jgi:hypothetical protein
VALLSVQEPSVPRSALRNVRHRYDRPGSCHLRSPDGLAAWRSAASAIPTVTYLPPRQEEDASLREQPCDVQCQRDTQHWMRTP